MAMAPSSAPTASSIQTSGSGSPEANMDKMIAHQERMFNLSIKMEIAKSEHQTKMKATEAMGMASRA